MSGFWEGMEGRAQTVLENPSIYNVANWLSMGLLDLGKGAINPEKPLSLEHWLDSLGFASALYGMYETGKRAVALRKSVPGKRSEAGQDAPPVEAESGTEELKISARNTSRGNPNAINHFDTDLNTRQQNLLNQLPNYNSSVIVKKSDVNLNDLSALTAKTGDEFAMFTRGSQRLIIRGNSFNVNIDGDLAQQLYNAGYKWSGHTHPGIGLNVKIASEGDRFILEQFNQSRSSIYDSSGQFNIFGGD